MTQDLLVDHGEEYLMKNGFDSLTVTVGLYDDSSDNLSETSDMTNINSEPSNSNYAAQSVTVSANDISGNWGVHNDSKITFDFSDTTTSKNVDTAYVSYSFTSEDETSSNEHLLANPALSQTRDVGSIDTLEIAAGDLEIKVD